MGMNSNSPQLMINVDVMVFGDLSCANAYQAYHRKFKITSGVHLNTIMTILLGGFNDSGTSFAWSTNRFSSVADYRLCMYFGAVLTNQLELISTFGFVCILYTITGQPAAWSKACFRPKHDIPGIFTHVCS